MRRVCLLLFCFTPVANSTCPSGFNAWSTRRGGPYHWACARGCPSSLVDLGCQCWCTPSGCWTNLIQRSTSCPPLPWAPLGQPDTTRGNVVANATDESVGTWAANCICPNGMQYTVGDLGECQRAACFGGISTQCDYGGISNLRVNRTWVYCATISAFPTSSPTTFPTLFPTAFPTPFPTVSPIALPNTFPTASPTAFPTTLPTAFPTVSPTAPPTAFLTVSPTAFPTAPPTAFPTTLPTAFPTAFPTASPTSAPTAFPTVSPTAFPTALPIALLTVSPTALPTALSISSASSSSSSSDSTTTIIVGVVALVVILIVIIIHKRNINKARAQHPPQPPPPTINPTFAPDNAPAPTYAEITDAPLTRRESTYEQPVTHNPDYDLQCTHSNCRRKPVPMTLLCDIHTCPKCQGDKSSANDVCKSCSVKKDEAGYVESMELSPSQAVYAEAPKRIQLTESNYVEDDFDEFDA